MFQTVSPQFVISHMLYLGCVLPRASFAHGLSPDDPLAHCLKTFQSSNIQVLTLLCVCGRINSPTIQQGLHTDSGPLVSGWGGGRPHCSCISPFPSYFCAHSLAPAKVRYVSYFLSQSIQHWPSLYSSVPWTQHAHVQSLPFPAHVSMLYTSNIHITTASHPMHPYRCGTQAPLITWFIKVLVSLPGENSPCHVSMCSEHLPYVLIIGDINNKLPD
jgi:hypothetical protein